MASQHARPAENSGQLLFWTLDGPLETAIAVIASPTNPDQREPYYNQATGTWHPIANLPISDPKVASITVHVSILEEWENMWKDTHCEHSEPDMPEAFEGVEWGALDGNDSLTILRCCGQELPRGKDASIVVTATNGEFVTVHDYVTTVHPWLMSIRGDILGALGTLYDKEGPLGDDTDLTLDLMLLSSLRTYEKRENWIRHKKGLPVHITC